MVNQKSAASVANALGLLTSKYKKASDGKSITGFFL